MTSPRNDQITYTFRSDERDAVRGVRNLRGEMGDLDRLGKTLAKTQRAEADATGKLKIAQAKLADARKSGKASASQLVAAEESVAKAQRALVHSAGEARSASVLLAKAQERAGDSADRTGRKLRGLRRSSDDSAHGFASVRKSVGGLTVGVGSMLGPLGLAAGAATAAGGGVLALGLAAYKGASQLQLLDNKARIVFGKSFPEVNKWAGRVANSMGLTRRELVSMTAGFADMLVPMGLSRGQAAKTAQQFARMAPILANWSGGTFDTQQAAEALTGALTGEYDTLQRLGIPISDALVQQEAMRLGLVKGKVDTDALSIAQQRASLAQTRYNQAVKEHGRSSEEARRASIGLQVAQSGVQKATAGSAGEISTAAKAQAALSLIMKGSTDAQKAFGASQQTLAAQAARLKAQFTEVKDELLVALIPAFTKLGKWVIDHQDEIIEFGFKAARGVITFGERTALAFADVLEWVGQTSVFVGRFVRGMIGGFAASGHASTALGILLGVGLSEQARKAGEALDRMSDEAGTGLIDAGNKARQMASSIRANVPPAANIARAKLEEVRRAALGLPTNPQIRPTTPGADGAIAKMNAVTRAANAIPERRTINVIAVISARSGAVQASITARNVTGSGSGRAFGGFVPGHSPGDYSDNIPATVQGRGRLWLTGKEFVVKRPTARKLERTAPGFLEALNDGRVDVGGDTANMAIRGGGRLRFATGGWVRAEDGSWVRSSFYGGSVRAEDGSYVPRSFYARPKPRRPRSLVSGAGGTIAKMLLNQVVHGRPFYEDFSFPHMPGIYRLHKGRMADAFWRENRGFDFGRRGTYPYVARWLRGAIGDAMKYIRAGRPRGVPLRFAQGGSIPAVQSFLRGTDPLPYIWGGAGPGGYDCSGLVGAAYGKLTGKGGGGGQRYFTTDTIGPGQGFRPGLGTFSVGVTPGRGHMAMQLGSLKAEARSTASGIIVGPGATSPKAFARQFFLPSLGGIFGADGLSAAQMLSVVRQISPAIVRQITRELGIRTADAGGVLTPGLNPPIWNGTGRPETVTTAGTMDAVVAELRAVRKAIETMPAARIDDRLLKRNQGFQAIRNTNGWG